MSDERPEAPQGAPGAGDAAAEATPDDASTDEEATPEQDVTDVPMGTPVSPEMWRELKRRADEPDDREPDHPNDLPE